MTSTTQPLSLGGADDPAAVLAYAREQKSVEDQAAREVMKAAAAWAAMHSKDSLVGPIDEWHEHALPLGGEGIQALRPISTKFDRPREAKRAAGLLPQREPSAAGAP